MKKFIIIAAALILCIPAISDAQPKAVGGRWGAFGLEASYQHSLAAGQNGYPNFVEADFGLAYWGHLGAVATATYNFVFAKPDWTSCNRFRG